MQWPRGPAPGGPGCPARSPCCGWEEGQLAPLCLIFSFKRTPSWTPILSFVTQPVDRACLPSTLRSLQVGMSCFITLDQAQPRAKHRTRE